IVEHAGIDQLVVDDDIRLAQRPRGAQSQQFRIAGAGADQGHLAAFGPWLAAVYSADQVAGGAALVAREHRRADWPGEDLIPEAAARAIFRDPRLDRRAE